MVRRHINHLRRWVVLSVIVMVFVVAGLMSAGRGLLLGLPYFIPQLEQLISDAPHFEVRIGALNGRWIQLSPRLEATDVMVELEGGSRIEVGRMELQFDPLRSVELGEVVFKQILLDQVDLSLFRSKQGWRLAGDAELPRQHLSSGLSANPDAGSTTTTGSDQVDLNSAASPSNSLLPLVEALLLHDELELRNATIQVQFEQHDPLPPQRVNLRLQNVGEYHALVGQLELAGEQAIDVRSVLTRLPQQPGFNADLYLNIPDIDQRFWNQLLPDDRPLPQQFAVGAELWGSWRADGRHRLQGSLRVPRLRWLSQPAASDSASVTPPSLLEVDDLSLQLQLQLDGLSQGELAIADLQGQVDGIELPMQRLSARLEDDQWLASVEQLALPPLWQWINGSSLVPDGLKQRLAGLDPVGRLANARLLVNPSGAALQPRFQFSADLHQVGVSAWQGAPALQGVDGLLQLDHRGGRVDFSSTRLGLDFPALYRQGWQFNAARGVVDWRIEPQQIRVQSQRLELAGDGVNANGRFSLELPRQPQTAPAATQAVAMVAGISSRQLREGQVLRASGTEQALQHTPAEPARQQPGRLVLLIGVEQADASLAPLFVPDKVVPPGLFGWLEKSITGGQIDSGGVLIDLPLQLGKTKANAGAELNPTVQLFFDVDNAELKYQPLWPQLSQAEPYVLYKDGELLIELPQGRILQSDVSQAQVYLASGSPLLQVDLHLDGPAADIRTALIEGPTGTALSQGLSPWLLTGNSRSRLQLGVDLKQPQRSLIRVESGLQQGQLSNPTLGLQLDQIAGQLRYHERDGLSAESLRGRLFDQPIRATIRSDQLVDGTRTQVDARGTVEMARLNRWLQQPLLNNLTGTTGYHAKLEICSAAPYCSNLRIDSQLQGVSAALPAPFGKGVDQRQPLSVDLTLETQPWMRLRYARQLDLLLPLAASPADASQHFNGAQLVLGRNQPPPAKQTQGLSIRGQLERLEAEPWFHFVNDNFIAETGLESAAGETVKDEANARGGIDIALRGVDLELGSVLLGELSVEQLHAKLTPQADSWLLQLGSPMVQGNVLMPHAPGPIRVDLDHLRLPDAADNVDPSPHTSASDKTVIEPFDPQQDPFVDLDPRTMSAAAISIESLSYGDRQLGRWQMQLQPQSDGLRIADLNAEVGHVTLQADIDWNYRLDPTTSTPIHSSDIELALKTGDLEQAMQAWNTSMGLETESALLSGQFNWRGSPLAFNWRTLGGEAQLQADNGRMLDTGRGSQVLKVFSLFNSQTIWRRLSLDFSDLAKDGISFDRISGHYQIKDGMVNSSTPLMVTGPTIDLQLEGSLDLVNDTIDQQMLVTLPVSKNLPVAAAFLVSPTIAGAVFLVEKLIGDTLSKFTSVRYRIDGDLNDPQINLLAPKQNNSTTATER